MPEIPENTNSLLALPIETLGLLVAGYLDRYRLVSETAPQPDPKIVRGQVGKNKPMAGGDQLSLHPYGHTGSAPETVPTPPRKRPQSSCECSGATDPLSDHSQLDCKVAQMSMLPYSLSWRDLLW